MKGLPTHDPDGNELELLWFPWCTSAYKDDYVQEKVPELEASGEYWGVAGHGGYIKVKLARNPYGVGVLDVPEVLALFEEEK